MWEFSLLDRYVIQVFKDLITECCRLNKCPSTANLQLTYELRCYQVAINQGVCIAYNHVGFYIAYARRRGREFTNRHFSPVCTQIYLVCQLHCKCAYRIIRIGLLRRITEQSDVKAIGIRIHICSEILNTGCRKSRVEILSISFPSDEIFDNAFLIPFVYDFIYFRKGTFSDAKRREFLRVKLSFD